MKKRVGRPKLGKNDAKGVLFAARFTPLEAKEIQAAIAKSPHSKSEWIRNALLSTARKDTHIS